ncbi:TVP38/TMEM64 family protein [Alteromonas oceanisediminis]|uniref:TVP38/TMEM64 family protein n=1 Tax=Alteromonas oceanisediminis TaxID=2836180 RepID=UPI001BDB1FBA|nr:VTT domain-containing protein [Alteromonas oceanisediminis]MBT0584816.1 VTT domain-containing protein [Alteromonas oceanisediminis]
MKQNKWFVIAVIVAIVAALVAVYFLTPINEYLKVDKIVEVTEEVPTTFSTALIFLGIFLLGGALMIPIPLMAMAVGLVFNIWVSVLIVVCGFVLAGMSGYGIGMLIDPQSFGEKFGGKVDKVREQVDDRGVWALLALRLAPTPPFTITSIISGSLRIKLWQYVLGTTLGIAPLGLSAAFFGKGAIELMREPSTIAASFLVAAAIVYIAFRVIKKRKAAQA